MEHYKSLLEEAANGSEVPKTGIRMIDTGREEATIALGRELADVLFEGGAPPPRYSSDYEVVFPRPLIVGGCPALALIYRSGAIYLQASAAVLSDPDKIVRGDYEVASLSRDIRVAIRRPGAGWLPTPAEALGGLPTDAPRLDVWTPRPGPEHDEANPESSVIAAGMWGITPAMSVVAEDLNESDPPALIARAAALLDDYLARHEVPARPPVNDVQPYGKI